MKRIIIPLLIIFIALLCSPFAISQQNKEDELFQKILDSYFDEMWKFYPTMATRAGYHKYDNKLEDFSSKNIEKRHEALDKFNQELVAKVDRFKMSPEFQIDHEIMVDALDLELFNHEGLLPWEYNPIFYNEIFNHCIRSLLIEEFAPSETRAKNASERLKDFPKLVKQAKENLKTPPQLFTETAIKQFPSILEFYKNELPQLIENTPAASKPKLQEYLAKAIPSLQDYQNFLQNELMARSTGSIRLGEQAHRRLIRLSFHNNIPLPELIARSKADYKNIRREMFLVCIPFYKIMDPKINLDNPPANLTEDQLINTTISHVLDKIKGEHPTQEDFLSQVKASMEEIKSFLLDNQLVDLPEEDINIETMPPASKGIAWTQLLYPGVYKTSGAYTFQISPLPEAWDEEKINSFLEEYNRFLLPFWTARHVYPGQFVPLFYLQKDTSIVKKMSPSLPLIKGWPNYIEDMLPSSGFGNYDLRLRLNQLKLRLRTAINFQLEFNIHEGGMTKDQAIAYMTRGGFQSRAEAERKWDHIILNPVDAAYAYVGLQEIIDMEKEYQKLKGESYNKREFLQKLLSFGPIPLRHLKKKVLE